METRQVEIFLDLVKTESIHKTAKNFFLSRPTVSTAIKRLEEELGLTLFHRHTGGMTLTEDGQEALYWLENIHSNYRNIKMISERKLSGTAHIQFPELFSLCHQNQSQKYAIYDLYPNLKLIATTTTTQQIIKSVLDPNDMQLHIFYTTPLDEFEPPKHPDIMYESFYEDQLCVIANKHHIYANRSKISFSNLFDELLILQTNHLKSKEIQWLFSQYNLSENQVFCTPPSFNGMCHAVRRRNGLALMTLYAIETSFTPKNKEEFCILRFKEDFKITWHYAYSKRNTQNTIKCFETYLNNNVLLS